MKLVSLNFKPEDHTVFINPPLLADEVYLFRSKGFKLTQDITESDIVVFTGGSDINPALYGEKPHERTHFWEERDKKDISAYRKSVGKFRIGICRGGQLLNVLSGGKLWQHVNNHHGSHDIRDIATGQIIETTSIHHQAFRPGKAAIEVATTKLSTTKEAEKISWYATSEVVNNVYATDYEVLFYPETRCLCIQGHPEMNAKDEFTEYFHSLVSRFYSLPVPVEVGKRIQV